MTAATPPIFVRDRYAYERKILRIADAHRRALARHLIRIQEIDMTGTDTPAPIKLTAMQIGVLKRGMNEAQFKLIGSEVGKSSGQLVAKGLIIPVVKGTYRLSDEGRAVVQQILDGHAAALDLTTPLMDEASGLNINDPALLEDRPLVLHWEKIAEERLKTIGKLNVTIDQLDALNADLRKQLEAAQTPAEIITTGINWDALVINPILDFIGQDYPAIATGNLPAAIVAYVSWLRESLHDAVALSDERTTKLDQAASQIESLSRCIDELKENLNARVINPSRAVDAMLAVQILDELCDLIPEVEDYRTARENAVKAIGKLKARGS